MAQKPDDKTLNNLEARLLEAIENAAEKVAQAESDREAANAKKAEARAILKAKGIKPKGFDMAMTIAAMDPDDQAIFFQSLQLSLKGLKIEMPEMQLNLFDPDGEPSDDADQGESEE